MNERIRELIKQATVLTDNPDERVQRLQLNPQLLVELVVNDVLNIVAVGGEFCSRPKLFEQIKERFGVEE